MKMLNVKKVLSFFLRDSKGFSLVEIMVAAGMLGIISVGVMQMIENMNKGQKRISQMSEIESMTYNIRLALRDRVGCRRTFTSGVAFAGPPAVPPTGGNVNPAAADPSGIPGAAGTNWAVNERIFDSNGNTVAQVGVIYGEGTQGRVRLQSIEVFGFEHDISQLPNIVPQAGPVDGLSAKLARVRLTFQKQGAQQATLGAMTVSQDIDVQFVRSGALGTTAVDCRTEEGAYITAACAAFGAFENGNACANLLVGDRGDIAPGPPPGVQLPYAFQTLGDVRIQGGANGLGGAGINNGALGVGETPTRRGSVDIRGSLAVGTAGSTAAAGANADGAAIFSNYVRVGPAGGLVGAGQLSTSSDVTVGGNETVIGWAQINGTTTSTGLITGNNGLTVNNAITTINGDDGATNLQINSDSTANAALRIGGGGNIVMTTVDSDFLMGGVGFTAGAAPSGLTIDGGTGRIAASGDLLLSQEAGVYLALKSTTNADVGITFERNDTGVDITGANSFNNGARLIMNGPGTAGKGDGEVVSNNDALRLEGAYLYAPEGAAWGGAGPNGVTHRVATRKFIENLLRANIDDTMWSNMMQDISEAITGLALDESNMLEGIANFVCRTIRITRGLAGGTSGTLPQTAAAGMWNAAGTCTFSDYFDDVIAATCPTGQYLYAVNGSGTFTCIEWPASPDAAAQNNTGTAGGVNFRGREFCAVMGAATSGSLSCFVKYFFVWDRDDCGCGAANLFITNICSVWGGAGFSNTAPSGNRIAVQQTYCPGNPSTLGTAQMDLRNSSGGNFDNAWPAMIHVGGPTPDCTVAPGFDVYYCAKVASQIRSE